MEVKAIEDKADDCTGTHTHTNCFPVSLTLSLHYVNECLQKVRSSREGEQGGKEKGGRRMGQWEEREGEDSVRRLGGKTVTHASYGL